MTATDGDARCHGPVVALPAASNTFSLDRVIVGMKVGCLAAQVNLVPYALAPTSLLWCYTTGVHPKQDVDPIAQLIVTHW